MVNTITRATVHPNITQNKVNGTVRVLQLLCTITPGEYTYFWIAKHTASYATRHILPLLFLTKSSLTIQRTRQTERIMVYNK